MTPDMTKPRGAARSGVRQHRGVTCFIAAAPECVTAVAGSRCGVRHTVHG